MKLVSHPRAGHRANTFTTVRDLSIKLEKTPVEVNDARISNHARMPLLNEAMFAVMVELRRKRSMR
jgi:hypothetical protein